MSILPEAYLVGLETENTKLKKALEKYADPTNWDTSSGGHETQYLDEWMDFYNNRYFGPDIARQALGLSRLEYDSAEDAYV